MKSSLWLALAVLLAGCNAAANLIAADDCVDWAREANTKEAWSEAAVEEGMPGLADMWDEEMAAEGRAWDWATCMSERYDFKCMPDLENMGPPKACSDETGGVTNPFVEQ